MCIGLARVCTAAFLVFSALPALAGETIAVADAEAYHRGVSKEELKRFRDLYTESLRKAGANVVKAYGRKADLRGVEFVTSLSVGRTESGYVLTGQVSRIRLDRWAARSETKSAATDATELMGAIDSVAAGVVAAVNNAPPRSTSQPPRKPRETRTRDGGARPPPPAEAEPAE